METYDVVVVGAGPGGYDAARILGENGKSVLLIEKDNLGGVCTNCGCIPTKSLLNSAKTYFHAKNGSSIGVETSEIYFNLSSAQNWKNETISTLRDSIAFQLKNAKVDTIIGQAIVKNDTVCVNDKEFVYKDLIIATGSKPFLPPIPGIESSCVKTSTDLLAMQEIPRSIAIIGGGVIGIEFASLYSMLGSEVSVIEMLDEILPMTEVEVAKVVKREMKTVSFNLGCKVVSIKDGAVNFIDSKQNEKSIQADVVLVSTGRKANNELAVSLGLETNKNGTIKVDSSMKTSRDHIWAIGDVNGLSQLAHSASEMAKVCAQNILGNSASFNSETIPWAVYSCPEVSGCGLTQAKAESRGIVVNTASFMLRGNGRFLAENGKRAGGLVKVIADSATDRILGIHMVGSYASEVIGFASFIVSNNLTKSEALSVVLPHPSVGEAVKTAIEML